MSREKDDEYFSDGITEEVINALANVEGLHVVSRTSPFAFKGRNVSVRTIGEELAVASVLEGSVRREGSAVRITAQLITRRTDTISGRSLTPPSSGTSSWSKPRGSGRW